MWLGFFFPFSFPDTNVHSHPWLQTKVIKSKELVYHEMAIQGCTLRCRMYQDKNTTWFLAFPVFMFGARGTQVIFQSVYITVRFSRKNDSICWNLYRILLTLLGLILDYWIYRSSWKKWVCCVYLIKCRKKVSQASFIFASQFWFPFCRKTLPQ